MTSENHEAVRAILFEVKKGLSPYVVQNYKMRFSAKGYLDELRRVSITLEKNDVQTEEEAIRHLDSHGCLNAIVTRREVFKKKLGHEAPSADLNVLDGFSHAGELLNARNTIRAHDESPDSISDETVFRLADTATRLLNAIKARNEAAITEGIKLEFGRKIFSAESLADEPEPVQEQDAHAEAEDRVSEEHATRFSN